MKLPALFAAVSLTAVAAGCGGADSSVASQSDAATIACTTQTLGEIFTTDCSTLSGTDAASCLIGTPPVCTMTKPGACACTGEGTNLYAAAEVVGLCSPKADQTRAGLLKALCAAEVDIAKGEIAKACTQIQSFESKVYEKQIKALDKDIQTDDADLLRAAAQAIEAELGCSPVTPVL